MTDVLIPTRSAMQYSTYGWTRSYRYVNRCRPFPVADLTFLRASNRWSGYLPNAGVAVLHTLRGQTGAIYAAPIGNASKISIFRLLSLVEIDLRKSQIYLIAMTYHRRGSPHVIAAPRSHKRSRARLRQPASDSAPVFEAHLNSTIRLSGAAACRTGGVKTHLINSIRLS